MVSLDLFLLGANGDTIPLDGSQGIHLTTGLSGLGIPATQVRIDNAAGDGGRWRSTRRGIRELDLPLVIIGENRGVVEEHLRRLARALNDRYGTPRLLGNYSDGESYDIEIHYTGGAETRFGPDAGETYCRWPITVQCPEPFWTSRRAVNFSLSSATGTRGLLPELDRLLVQSSQILGAFVIENTGDVEAYPVWTFTGPADSITVTLNGQGFSYTTALGLDESITIDTRAATVRDGDGVNRYAGLAAAPKLFPFPPGQSTIEVNLDGAEASSRVSGYYLPRREVLF